MACLIEEEMEEFVGRPDVAIIAAPSEAELYGGSGVGTAVTPYAST